MASSFGPGIRVCARPAWHFLLRTVVGGQTPGVDAFTAYRRASDVHFKVNVISAPTTLYSKQAGRDPTRNQRFPWTWAPCETLGMASASTDLVPSSWDVSVRTAKLFDSLSHRQTRCHSFGHAVCPCDGARSCLSEGPNQTNVTFLGRPDRGLDTGQRIEPTLLYPGSWVGDHRTRPAVP